MNAPYITRDEISERLQKIFVEGTPNRNYCVRMLAASTVFVMLYIDAVEGTGQYLGPKHVYRMNEDQAGDEAHSERAVYAKKGNPSVKHKNGERWYADNTREPIRDETLREGLSQVGAVGQRDDVPTSSSKPRYYLKADFASLFDPSIKDSDLDNAIELWRKANLSASALARLKLASSGAINSGKKVPIILPNGEIRQMEYGPSSDITKAVVEVFAKQFLENPAVLWISESGNKTVSSDESLAESIGINIKVDRDLPDIILVDIGAAEILIVFVEVVASDGPVSARRKNALHELTDEAGFDRCHVTFVTAYMDRGSAAFKKTVSALAWGSFAWFVSEPEQLIALSEDGNAAVRKLHRWIDS